jgi:hypothetical protein
MALVGWAMQRGEPKDLLEVLSASDVRTPLSLHKKFSAALVVASSNILQHILVPYVATDSLHPVQMVREQSPNNPDHRDRL